MAELKHNYPCFLSKPYVASVFSNHGFSLVNSFRNRYGDGFSEYLVFTRNKPAQQGAALDGDSAALHPRQ